MTTGKKILLVQLFNNGDCLYATAVARQIKHDYPGCHLTWAISDFCQDIIKGNPYVDAARPVSEVIKSDVVTFRKFKKKVFAEKKRKLWDEVIVTQGMDENQAFYDGTIRGMILRAYGKPVTQPLQPVLMLNDEEKQNVACFADLHRLAAFKNVVLWEFAPQSGQAILNFDFVRRVAKKIVAIPNTCVVLSSALAFEGTDTIIDASNLSVRENAALTHYCSLLIGCSSGITWVSTSSAAKQLPMVQLLNPLTPFLNAPSVDFKRYKISSPGLIEITTIEEDGILACVKMIMDEGFSGARIKFNEHLPLQFNTTRKIVYNMLCYLHLDAINRHYKIITGIYGVRPEFIKQLMLAIVTFPFKLIGNKWRKWTKR